MGGIVRDLTDGLSRLLHHDEMCVTKRGMNMNKDFSSIPVIDIFAGPGGLGEGFSAVSTLNGKPFFNVVLAIEKDGYAHRTLELRAFYRQFERGASLTSTMPI